jgi:hypothetical protein
MIAEAAEDGTWILDPKPIYGISEYSAFNNTPVWLSDLLGDTSIKTPGGTMMDIGDNKFEIFSGAIQKVGNRKIQPAKGTLKSFTVTGENVDNKSVRFVAVFDKESGAFQGYAWDKDTKYSYGDFIRDARKDLADQYSHSNDILYQHYSSPDEARKAFINNSLAVTLPNPILKSATAATNAATTGITVLGKYPDYLNLAEQLGARRFNVPTNIWNRMSAAEQWTANTKFLDRTILRGDKIILSNPVSDINKVSGAFRQELDYLIGKGYRLSSAGTQLIK